MTSIIVEQWLNDFNGQMAGAEFPPWHDTRWHTFTGHLEAGKQEGKAEIAGEYVARIHEDLAARPFIDAIGVGLGYEVGELIADPDRIGGGIHQIAPGGRLALHVDFNVKPDDPTLVRAVNVIVFLSEWGIGALDAGALVMRVGGVEMRVSPSPGLLVAWRAEDDIYHGHPDPFPTVESLPRRRSIAVYYYRKLRDGERIEPRSTTWMERT